MIADPQERDLAPGRQACGDELRQSQCVTGTQAFALGRQQAASDLEHGAAPIWQQLLRESGFGLVHGIGSARVPLVDIEP